MKPTILERRWVALRSARMTGTFALVLLALLLALTGCVPAVVSTAPAGCSSLVPQSWKQGVEGAELPVGDTVGDWLVFGDAQTGKLDQANGRTRDSIEIVERCEARDAAAVKKATAPWWKRIF